jgi:hypothetical protein
MKEGITKVATAITKAADKVATPLGGAIITAAAASTFGTAAAGLGFAGGGVLGDKFQLPPDAVEKVAQWTNESLAQKQYKRTTDFINIMMPESVQYTDQASWKNIDATASFFGLLSDVAGQMSYGTSFSDALGNIKETGKFEIVNMVTNAMVKNGDGIGEATQAKTLAPFSSQAFAGMQRRSFRFSWRLMPKNSDELNSIQKIIKLLRTHMRPSLDNNNLFLEYPSRVEIFFMSNDKENKNLPKLTECVLTDVSVNYTPNNQWSALNATNGAPSGYELSIAVTEIVPLLKQDMEHGY